MCEHAVPAGGDSDGIYSYEALESLIKHVKAQEHQKTEFSFRVQKMIFHYAQENSKLVFNIKNNEIFVFLTLFWFSPDITINLGKDQLQNKYDKLSNNYTQLQETVSGKKKKGNSKYTGSNSTQNVCIISLIIDCCVSHITANNNQLKNSYETLSKNHSKLQDQVKKLKDEIKGEKNEIVLYCVL